MGRGGGGWFREVGDFLLVYFFPPASSRLLPTCSVERSDGSQEEEAVEAVVLVL